MTALPDWDELLESGLNGLEQYLAWALSEMRRIAITEEQQQIVRLAFSTAKLNKGDEEKYEGLLRAEVNLPYSSFTALENGLNFLSAISSVSDLQAEAPRYRCVENTASYMKNQIIGLRDTINTINTLEKFLFWLCASWRLSLDDAESSIEQGAFSFLEENQGGAIVKFKFDLPLNYYTSLESNLVCAAYVSPYRDSYNYAFADIGIFEDPKLKLIMGNSSVFGNNFVLGN